MEKPSMRCRELIATNELTAGTKPLFDLIVMEDGQDDGRLADSTSTN